jgi:hypothetical protein
VACVAAGLQEDRRIGGPGPGKYYGAAGPGADNYTESRMMPHTHTYTYTHKSECVST